MKKKIDKTILIIFSFFLGFLIISPLFDTYASDLEKRMQTVDPVLEAKFLLMERGKIPIGECADEAEDLAEKIMDQMYIVDENITKEISAGNELFWLPELCGCANCENECDCTYDPITGECVSCHCTQCEGDVCPFDEIEKKVDTIQEADDKIIEAGQKIEDLIEAENLTECDPDRWEILNKLRNSRYKMEECVQGFESALKHPRTEVNFLSCRTALNEIDRESGGLVLLEYFENHISDYPYCYPYTANSAIREVCKDNRDSDDCHIPLKGCMDNYFCAGFVGPTGELGGNKEGDESPVCDGTEIPDDDEDEEIAGTVIVTYSYGIDLKHKSVYCGKDSPQTEYSIGNVNWYCDSEGNNCVETWVAKKLAKECCGKYYKDIVDAVSGSIPSESNMKIIYDCMSADDSDGDEESGEPQGGNGLMSPICSTVYTDPKPDPEPEPGPDPEPEPEPDPDPKPEPEPEPDPDPKPPASMPYCLDQSIDWGFTPECAELKTGLENYKLIKKNFHIAPGDYHATAIHWIVPKGPNGELICMCADTCAHGHYFKYVLTNKENTIFDVYAPKNYTGTAAANVLRVDTKPVIYLYPEEKTQIKAKIKPKGRMIESIPAYGNGWDVTVDANGLINKEFDYLFYETEINENQIKQPFEGFLVEFDKLEKFFDEVLPQLGLQGKEIIQFKEWWLNKLEPSQYYLIKLLERDVIDEIEEMEIDPKPDTVIRIRFLFIPFENKTETIPPEIAVPAERQGFTVVEWGGLIFGE